jgi:hypothetical protein
MRSQCEIITIKQYEKIRGGYLYDPYSKGIYNNSCGLRLIGIVKMGKIKWLTKNKA